MYLCIGLTYINLDSAFLVTNIPHFSAKGMEYAQTSSGGGDRSCKFQLCVHFQELPGLLPMAPRCQQTWHSEMPTPIRYRLVPHELLDWRKVVWWQLQQHQPKNEEPGHRTWSCRTFANTRIFWSWLTVTSRIFWQNFWRSHLKKQFLEHPRATNSTWSQKDCWPKSSKIHLEATADTLISWWHESRLRSGGQTCGLQKLHQGAVKKAEAVKGKRQKYKSAARPQSVALITDMGSRLCIFRLHLCVSI